MRRLPLLLVLATALTCTPPPSTGPGPSGQTSRVGFPFDWEFRGLDPTATGVQGLVSTADIRATRVGLQILQAGGNALDAAVAVGFALAVVDPAAGNIGGGGFMVIHAADGEAAALDFREAAPLLVTPDVYLDEEGRPTDASLIGPLAAGVPGTVAGMAEAHARYGSLPWDSLLQPAIDLAENGFTVTERLNRKLVDKSEPLQQFQTTRQIFYPGGQPPRIGSTFRQPMLAATLRIIAAEGKAGFYSGRIADMIVQEMREGNGLISHEGLRRYAAKWRDPIMFEYRGFRVISMPPPSSGGVAIAEILNIMEGYDVRELGFNTPEQIHLVVESFRRAFADRNYYMGDPDFVNIPVERLISDEYARELRSTISRTRATPSASVNRVPVLSEGANTTHYSVVDGAGLAVAVSYTINTDFGSGVVVGGAGFFLNNEMDDFTMRAGHANYYGLVQSDANLVGPGRRPLSSMTPTIVIDSTGALLAVLGSPGGAKIITAVSQVIMNLVDFDMDVRTAVDAPRVHHQLLPDRLLFETDGVDAISLGSLAQMGHDIYPNSGYFGSVQLIIRTPDGVLHGASDPRNKDGRALGY